MRQLFLQARPQWRSGPKPRRAGGAAPAGAQEIVGMPEGAPRNSVMLTRAHPATSSRLACVQYTRLSQTGITPGG